MRPASFFNRDYFANYLGTDEGYLEKLDEHLFGFADLQADYRPYRLPGRRVFELGCAMGHVLADLVKNGVEASGIEFSNYALQRVAEPLRDRVVKGDARDWIESAPPRSWDIVHCNIFMYFEEQEVRRMLEKLAGIACHSIYVIVPFSDLPSTMPFRLPPPGKNLRVGPGARWLRYYSRAWWRGQLLEAGFKRVKLCASDNMIAYVRAGRGSGH